MTLEHIVIQMQEEEQERVRNLLSDVFRLGSPKKKTTPTQDRQTLAISMECLQEASARIIEWAAEHGLTIDVNTTVGVVMKPEPVVRHIVLKPAL